MGCCGVTGRLIDMSMGMNRRPRITLELDGNPLSRLDPLKDVLLDIEIRKHREKRSLSANAYFHVLVNKIAAETGESDEAVKVRLVLDYGVVDKDGEGKLVGFKLPQAVDPTKYWPYTKYIETREENGKLFNCYLFYKHTSDMDSKEMARLIDGAISEARELGIETDTPEQLARFKEDWSR